MASSYARKALDQIFRKISSQKEVFPALEHAMEVVTSPPLEIFKRCVDVTLGNMV